MQPKLQVAVERIIVQRVSKIFTAKFRESTTETILAIVKTIVKGEKRNGVLTCYGSLLLATAVSGKPCPVQGQELFREIGRMVGRSRPRVIGVPDR